MDNPGGACNDEQLRRNRMEKEFISRMTKFNSNMNKLKMYLTTRGDLGGRISENVRRALRRWAVSHYMEGNNLYYKWRDMTLKVLCSGEEVFAALTESHSNGSQHFGINATQEIVVQKYFWKGLSIDVRNFISYCPVCQKQAKSKTRAPTLERRHATQPVGLVDVNMTDAENETPACVLQTELDKSRDLNRETPLHSIEEDRTCFQIDEPAGTCKNIPSLEIVSDDSEECVELVPVLSNVSDDKEKCVELAPVITIASKKENKMSSENSTTFIADCESIVQETRLANASSKMSGKNVVSSTFCLRKKTDHVQGVKEHNNGLTQKQRKTSTNSIPMLNFHESLKVYRQRAIARLYDPSINMTDNCFLIAPSQIEPAPKLFKCNICGASFKDNSCLLSHKRMHNIEQINQFDTGGAKFVMIAPLLTRGEVHTPKNPYLGDISNAKLVTLSSLQTRKIIHKRQDLYLCEICGEKCATLYYLQIHRQLHAQKDSIRCEICGPSFEVESTLSRHNRIWHNVKTRIKTRVTSTRHYKCDVCFASFFESDSLKKHRRKHIAEKPYKCNICGTSFKHGHNLTEHRRKHTGERPYQCDKCGVSYEFKYKLKNHTRALHSGLIKRVIVRKRTGEKPYKCNLCKSSFAYNCALNQHKKIHTGEKPYQCDVCGASFRSIHNLSTHGLVHTGEKSFLCDACGATFLDKGAFWRHRIIHTGERPYKCEICESTFNFIHNLKSHKRVHTGDKPYKCDTCGASFRQCSYLTIHKRIHTGERPYQCCICNASFARKDILQKHKRVH